MKDLSPCAFTTLNDVLKIDGVRNLTLSVHNVPLQAMQAIVDDALPMSYEWGAQFTPYQNGRATITLDIMVEQAGVEVTCVLFSEDLTPVADKS